MTLMINRPEAFKNPPAAVIFDTDNTLYAYEPAHAAATRAAVGKACKLVGCAEEAFVAAYTEARREVKQQLGETAASHSRLLYFQRTIEILGLRTQLLMTLDIEQTYWRNFLSASVLFPDVRDFIFDLRSIGARTAIITDLTAQIQFRKIIYFGLDDSFDYVVTSEEAGVDKPNKAPFSIALNKLQVAAKDMWMIGDNPISDIQGAAAFGMTTLQKRHEGVDVATGSGAADGVFDHFSELRQLIAKSNWLLQDRSQADA